MSAPLHTEPICRSNSILNLWGRGCTEEKRRNKGKATRRHKRTRDDEGMVEELVQKEVYKIKQAKENVGESMLKLAWKLTQG
jgi:hypothetical protein